MIEVSPDAVEQSPQSPSEAIRLEPWQREVDGIFRAMQFIHQKARGVENGGLGREDILNIHKIVMNDPFNPEKTGVLRQLPVIVRGKIGGEVKKAAFEPEDVHFLSEYFNEFASELQQKTTSLSADTSVKEVVELSAWAHRRFIEIHPFEDGNGRTARLLIDFIFRKARLPYIKDWGAGKDEYNEVVYRIYSEDNLSLLKLFLAQKLYLRLSEIEHNYAQRLLNETEFPDYAKRRLQETEEYIEDLQDANNAV